MSRMNGINIFTDDELKLRDKMISAKIHQMTVKSTARKIIAMNPAQQLRSLRDGGKDLYWSEAKLDKALAYILDD